MRSYKIVSWLTVITSIAIIILPRLVPICTAGTAENPMRCYFAYQAEFFIALLSLILSGSLLAAKSKETRLLAGFIILLLGLIVVIIPQPWAIGICRTEGAACHKTTFFADILGILLALEGLIIVWLNRKIDQKDGGKEEDEEA